MQFDISANTISNPSGSLVAPREAEHFTAELVDRIHQDSRFDLLVPVPQTANLSKRLRGIPEEKFTRRWSGYATAVQPYALTHSQNGPFSLFVQRLGEVASNYQYKAFLSTRAGGEVEALTQEVAISKSACRESMAIPASLGSRDQPDRSSTVRRSRTTNREGCTSHAAGA